MELCSQDIYRSVFKEYPDIMTVEQVGKALGVSAKIVYRLVHSEKIKSLKTGRVFLIPKINLMKYVKIFDSPLYELPKT